MIRYSLQCAADHEFDSWFQSSAAFDALASAARLACPVCGDKAVTKSLMAPALRQAVPAVAARDRPLGAPASAVEAALAALRRQIEENSDYVGLDFATEARRIHDGDAPARAIYGEARADDARALIEDGVRVSPLPFLPARKAN